MQQALEALNQLCSISQNPSVLGIFSSHNLGKSLIYFFSPKYLKKYHNIYKAIIISPERGMREGNAFTIVLFGTQVGTGTGTTCPVPRPHPSPASPGGLDQEGGVKFLLSRNPLPTRTISPACDGTRNGVTVPPTGSRAVSLSCSDCTHFLHYAVCFSFRSQRPLV